MNTVSVYIMESEHNPIHLWANGITATINVGEDTPIDERLMPLLRDTPGVKWRYTGELHTDLQAPAVDAAFDATEIIDGTVDDVESRLSDLTAEQLLSVRAAEEGRDGATRKGVLRAIDAAFEALNEKE